MRFLVGSRADVGIGPYENTCVFSVGGDALIAPRGMSPERAEKTDTPVPSAPGPMWASAPTKNNVRFQRRGRCPHRTVGYVDRAGGKNGHACTVGFRADVGIGPYKTTCVFSVGGDALIAPWGVSPERAEKTDTSVPSASGPMWASAPTKNNVRLQRRGRCPHRPAVYVDRAVRKNGHVCTARHGPMWASAPTKNGRSLAVGGVRIKGTLEKPVRDFPTV